MATGAFDEAIEIFGKIKGESKYSLLNLRTTFTMPIKSDFITEYKNRVAKEYPDLTINDYLPLEPTSSLVPDDISISEILSAE